MENTEKTEIVQNPNKMDKALIPGRRAARELAFTILFERGFDYRSTGEIIAERLDPESGRLYIDDAPALAAILPDAERDYLRHVCEGAEAVEPEFRDIIGRHSTNWKLGRVSRVCGAILRVAVFEMKYMDDIDESVSINEAVELAKKYDTDEGASFVNGVLGALSREGQEAK